MPEPTTPAVDWPEQYAIAVGKRVRRFRRDRGLTVQQLAATLAALGVTMNRAVLSNLENGYRASVTAAEVLALAVALRVPPVLLLLPVGESPDVELPGGHVVDTWQAAEWLAGERPTPGQPGDPQWRADADLLALYREHAQLVDEYLRQTRVAPGGGDVAALLERAADARRLIGGHLRRVRQTMRDRDIAPPTLPAELAHLDDGAQPLAAENRRSPGSSEDYEDAFLKRDVGSVTGALDARRSRRGFVPGDADEPDSSTETRRSTADSVDIEDASPKRAGGAA